MRAYTFVLGRLMPGIATTKDEALKEEIVFLGNNDGPKSKCKKVSMDKSNPAQIKDGLITFAHPRTIGKDKSRFLVLARPDRGINNVLLRVNTGSLDSNSKSRGWWTPKDGNAQVKYEAKGCRPNGSTYCDDLVTLAPGDSIIAYPEGEEKGYELKNTMGKLHMWREK